jgi:hypothetical protein
MVTITESGGFDILIRIRIHLNTNRSVVGELGGYGILVSIVLSRALVPWYFLL